MAENRIERKVVAMIELESTTRSKGTMCQKEITVIVWLINLRREIHRNYRSRTKQ